MLMALSVSGLRLLVSAVADSVAAAAASADVGFSSLTFGIQTEEQHIPHGFTYADDARVHSLFRCLPLSTEHCFLSIVIKCYEALFCCLYFSLSLRSSHQKNFGHVFSDDMLSTEMVGRPWRVRIQFAQLESVHKFIAFTFVLQARDVFDLSSDSEGGTLNDGRLVLLEHPEDKIRIKNVNRFSSNQGFSWYWAMYKKNATFIEDYGEGTCFRHAVLGHTSAFSVGYFTQMRAPSARKFRQSYAHNIGLTWLYPTRKQQQQQQQHVGLSRRHRIVLYCKTGGSNGSVWPHLCAYAAVLRKSFPEAEVF
jgi:hypothetical protein